MTGSTPRLFISYARTDDEPFVRRLYRDLIQQGFSIWWDRVSMPSRALTFLQEIRDAIDEADRLLLVAGLGALRSDHVRAEWEYALNGCKIVVPILRKCDFDALPPELTKLHIVDCRRDGFLNRTYRAQRADLLRILRTPERPVGRVLADPLPLHFIARSDDLDAIAECVLADVNRPTVVTSAKQTTSLQGMGGVGKTVLAKAFCHDCRTRRAFSDGVYWVTLGQTPNLLTALMTLGAQLGDSPSQYTSEPVATARLRQYLADKVALIVLDDVWNPKHARPFLVGGPRCRLLVTTRLFEVVSAISGNERKVGTLPAEKALVLLSNWADGIPAAERETAFEIAEQCGYLPLALSIAGALLRDRRACWRDVLEALRQAELDFLDNEQGSVAASIKTSLDYLAGSIATYKRDCALRCYESLAIFPEDMGVPEATILRFWMQDGLIARDAVRLLAEMVNKALLFREGTDRYRLHDLQRDFIRYSRIRRGEDGLVALHNDLLASYRIVHWADLSPNEPYLWQHLAYHLLEANRRDELRAMLFDFRYLAARLNATYAAALLADCDLYLAAVRDDSIRLLRSALSMSVHVLMKDKTALTQQLCGRLCGHSQNPDMAALLGEMKAISSSTIHCVNSALLPAGGALLRVLGGHAAPVNGALVLSDGRFLSWAKDKTLRLWSEQGEPLAVLEGHTGGVASALVLSDGRILSWAEGYPDQDYTLRLWSGQGKPLAILEGHTAVVHGMLALPDGRLFSWSDDHTLRLWSGRGKPLAVLQGHWGAVWRALALANGRFLSWTLGHPNQDCALRLWDEQGKPLAVLKGHTYGVEGALALSDGRFLSWATKVHDCVPRLWSTQGKLQSLLQGHTEPVYGVLELSDGRFLTWAEDKTLRLWSRQGEPLAVLQGHYGAVWDALELSDGRFLSRSNDSNLRLWSRQGEPLAVLQGHYGPVGGALELSDGRILSWPWTTQGGDCAVRLWSGQGEPLTALEGHSGKVTGVMVLADGRFLTWAEDKTLRMWSGQGKPLVVLRGHIGAVEGALALSDGRFLSWARDDPGLRLWAGRDESLTEPPCHTDGVTEVLALPDGYVVSWAGSYYSTTKDYTLRLWNGHGEPLAVLHDHTGPVQGALALADGRFLSWAKYDRALRLWSGRGEPLSVMWGHADSVAGALALADGRFLSWANDDMNSHPHDYTLRLWSGQGEPLAILEGHTDAVRRVLALSDGRFLSCADDLTLRLWSGQGKPLAILKGHSRTVYHVLALSDGRFLSWVTGFPNPDCPPRLWSKQGDPLGVLKGHTSVVNGALALSDGRFLSWSHDHTLRLWSRRGEPLAIMQGHTDSVSGTLVLSDGRLLSWAEDKTLRLWSEQGELLAVMQGHTGKVASALVLSDGRMLSWAGGYPNPNEDYTLRLWTGQGAPLAILEGHVAAVHGALTLSDGRLLSWADGDPTLRLWDTMSGRQIGGFYGDAPITCCTLTADRQTIVAGDTQGRVMFLRWVP